MRIFHRFAVLLFVAAVPGPATARPAHAIAHGQNAGDGAYRFSALLTMTGLPTAEGGSRDSSCSGALVAPRWVITAGHCFRDAAGRRVSRPVADRTVATIGRADLTGSGGHRVEVVAVRQAGIADVALAELASAITDIEPLRVAAAPPAVGEVVRLTGYGLTLDGTPADRLQTGQFVVEAVGDTVVETSGRAPRRDTSPCPHDSGGPYFRQRSNAAPVLVAVVSTGPGCPHPGPESSARTDNLHGWITRTVADEGAGRGRRALLVAGLAGLPALAALLATLLLARRRRAAMPRRGVRRDLSRRPPVRPSR
ncbi:trypsin-like serine protease [Plantactinospora siamensis]|uniref:Trypsin-like serine protease n=1 Tax=Plantactinospora siamensis TaxID=555372 RepID=A0ABV6P3Y3_9ACTN